MDYDIARARLINQLAAEIQDKRVLAAMSRVPRELFVPAALAGSAYDNAPLPIGANQTISQPYIVALMTASLDLNPQKRYWKSALVPAIRPRSWRKWPER